MKLEDWDGVNFETGELDNKITSGIKIQCLFLGSRNTVMMKFN